MERSAFLLFSSLGCRRVGHQSRAKQEGTDEVSVGVPLVHRKGYRLKAHKQGKAGFQKPREH